MSRETGARLFVAVVPPSAVRDSLAWWARDAGRGRASLRLLDRDLLHVTVCFLGTRAVSDIDAIVAALGHSGAPVGSLGVGAPVWLPPRRPRALAVEVRDEAGELSALVHELSGRLAAALDWKPDRRRYRPHITVARMREGAAPRERALPPTPPQRFAAQSLTLYRSYLSAAGASYEPLARVGLEGV